MRLGFGKGQCRLTAALPFDLVFASCRRQVSLDLILIRFEAFFSVLKAVALLFALAKLQPVAERFFKPKARAGEEEPC